MVNPDVRETRIEGDLEAGGEFRVEGGAWKPSGPPFGRLIGLAYLDGRERRWVSRRSTYRLEEVGGETRVVLEESWDGALARILRKPFQKKSNKAVRDGLRALKTEAEHRPSG